MQPEARPLQPPTADFSSSAQAHQIERQPHDVAGREAAQGRRLGVFPDDAHAAAELDAHPVDAGIDDDRSEAGEVLADQQCPPRATSRSGQALRAEDLGLEGKRSCARLGRAGEAARSTSFSRAPTRSTKTGSSCGNSSGRR